jgi:hypothetical protein
LLAAGLALAATAAPAQTASQIMSTTRPVAFIAALRDMGYTVEADPTDPKGLFYFITIAGVKTDLILSNCLEGKDCRVMLLSSSFSDVPNVAPDWITDTNSNLDLLKVYRNDSGTLGFRSAYMTKDVTRAQVRLMIEIFDEDVEALSQKVTKDGLVVKKPAASN